MPTQWHPIFANMLGILLGRWYTVEPEVPISDLPRTADLLLIRREGTESPPFAGVWSHLTDWNVVEFKAPSDDPEQDDLDLLMAVGTGLAVRLNEKRLAEKLERLEPRQVSFWFLAPKLGDTFRTRLVGRAPFRSDDPGVWTATVWGHRVWFVSYRDLVTEQDNLPFFLVDREQPEPPGFRSMLLNHQELLQTFAAWFFVFRPDLWEEMRRMGTPSKPLFDWDAISKVAEPGTLEGVVRVLPPERIIELMGVQEAVRVIGVKAVIESVGLPRVIESVGLPAVIESVGLPALIESAGLPALIECVGLPAVIESVGLSAVLSNLDQEAALEWFLDRTPPEEMLARLQRRIQQEPPKQP